MREIDSCVICGGVIRKLKKALIAPFLAARIWKRDPFCVDLVCCKDCGFLFYNPRLEDDEAARLYRAYRSDEYLQERHRFEPWYSRAMNAGLASAEHYDERRKILREILRPHAKDNTIKKVLDHGGDHGDLVADLVPGAEAYVYDISGVAPASGVVTVSEPMKLRADLVVNSNVLEHVGFPLALAKDVVRCAATGGLIYFEVPFEKPFGASRLCRRIAQVAITSLLRPTQAGKVVRPASLYLMHEHINYYSEKSLRALMQNAGATILASGSYPLASAAGRGEMGWCLGARNSSSS